MTPAEQNEAIALACGTDDRWTIMKRGLYYRPNANGYATDVRDAWIVTEEVADQHVYPHDEPVTKKLAPPLNYIDDLNAMHEAEKTLDYDDASRYIKKVSEIVEASPLTHMLSTCTLCTTAAQRAEAFLKTLNLWTE